MNKKIMLLDVQTLDVKHPFIYEVSYGIYEKIGDEYIPIKLVDRLNKNIYKLVKKGLGSFSKSNADFYEKYESILPQVGLTRILAVRNSDIKDFGIKTIYSFNATFDRRAIAYTAINTLKAGLRNPLLRNIPYTDIGAKAKKKLYNTEAYQAYCKKHGYSYKVGKEIKICATANAFYSYVAKKPKQSKLHVGCREVIKKREILKAVI